jgi:chromosomal replication initiation ATPase DnaA
MRESIVDISLYEMKRRFPDKKEVTLEDIFNDMERVFRFNPVMVKSRSKKGTLVLYRTIFCYVARFHAKFKLQRIGEFLDDRDHTTILTNTQNATKYLFTKDYDFMIQWNKYITNSTLWKEHLSVKNI